MKGLTHFTSGVAIASFFAPAVAAAASTKLGSPEAASSFIIVLGGWFGIMPDTLDFKFGRFFTKADFTLKFDDWDPDPNDMARQVAEALDHAAETGKPIMMQFDPMRLGASLWRQYVVKFDGEKNEVDIVINEIVNTSQVCYEGTAPDEEKRIGTAKLKTAKMLEKHGKPSVVDIMSGPMFGFKPQKFEDEDYVSVEFLPWHRTWSHSYILGLMLSVPVWIIAWLFSFANWWLYGIVSFLGYAIHITEDLTGHMGGSLIWPFSQTRYDGYCWFKASDPRANFSVDYTCFVMIIYNLDRFSTQVIDLSWYTYYFTFLVLPLALYFGIYAWFADAPIKEGAIKAENLLAEANANRNEEARFEEEIVMG